MIVLNLPSYGEKLSPNQTLNLDQLILDARQVTQHAQKNILNVTINNNLEWNLPSYLGSPYVSQYYLFLHYIQNHAHNFLNEAQFKSELLFTQIKESGAWMAIADPYLIELAPNESGELGTTIINYWALKVMGESIHDEPLRKARNFILMKGGLNKAPTFVKIFLALFKNYPWSKLPKIPLLILNETSPINMNHFGQWISPHMIAIAYLQNLHVYKKNSNPLFDLSELNINSLEEENDEPQVPTESMGKDVDKFEKLINKILNSQQPYGSWGGYTSATMLSLMALDHYQMQTQGKNEFNNLIDHSFSQGMSFLWERNFNHPLSLYKGHVCDGRNWDSALLTQALLASHYPKESLIAAGHFLIKTQHPTGGFSFGYDFEYAPDNDDTAETILALKDLIHFKPNINKSIEWLLSMQNNNGGWGGFAKNQQDHFILELFTKNFTDSADLFDEATADVTGHVLEALSYFNYNRENSKPIRKAIKFLKKTQNKKIYAWEGRWGINYIYGTSAALVGLLKVGEPKDSDYIKKSLDWIRSIQYQNQENLGGFGESTLSYTDIRYAGKGVSTPSQTAWALLPLIESGETTSSTVKRGIDYLIRNFHSNGMKWYDESPVGTGHPKIVYMQYPSYSYAFPLITLGRFLNALSINP